MINNEGFLKDIDKLESIINEYLSHWEIDKITKRMIAMDYINEFGLEDMIAFIDFCKKPSVLFWLHLLLPYDFYERLE